MDLAWCARMCQQNEVSAKAALWIRPFLNRRLKCTLVAPHFFAELPSAGRICSRLCCSYSTWVSSWTRLQVQVNYSSQFQVVFKSFQQSIFWTSASPSDVGRTARELVIEERDITENRIYKTGSKNATILFGMPLVDSRSLCHVPH